jgi:hypothetical protein
MESQLRDQLNNMQPIVEAARELVETIQPWLQASADFDPFSPAPNYPTWELDKHSFEALGKLLLAFRFAEPDAFVPAPPSDSMVLSRIYTLLEQTWPDHDTIDGPFIIQSPTEPTLAEVSRTWLAHVYIEPRDTWIGVRGWVDLEGSPTISHTATLRRRRERAP